jgi:hypothetical protein
VGPSNGIGLRAKRSLPCEPDLGTASTNIRVDEVLVTNTGGEPAVRGGRAAPVRVQPAAARVTSDEQGTEPTQRR